MSLPKDAPVESQLIIDGETLKLDELPEDIQAYTAVYTKWEGELEEAKAAVETARLRVFQLEAALRGIAVEVRTRLKKHREIKT